MRKRVLTAVCCLIVLAASMMSVSFVNSKNDAEPAAVQSGCSEAESISADHSEPAEPQEAEEMRGIWIPCMALQADDNERSEDSYRRKLSDIMQRCAELGFNNVIVQVRPFSDALYPSEYFPWSHIITGTQGEKADFDPLELMTEEAHSRGMKLHAWINPLRISLGSTPYELSDDNPFVVWQSDDDPDNDCFTFSCDNGIYYDPSYPQVRRLIINGVRELAEKYDIDGIQIDDYFYPSENTDYDSKSYEAYTKTVGKDCTPLSQQEWRKNNINMLIAGMSSALHSAKKDALFGISPQGNFDNNEKMSADTKSWCSYAGFADYICPQLYVSMEHPIFPFAELADRWLEYTKDNSIRLYLGLGLYKAGTDADDGTWLSYSGNIRDQILYCRQHRTDGYIIYSYEFLDSDNAAGEISNAIPELKASVT